MFTLILKTIRFLLRLLDYVIAARIKEAALAEGAIEMANEKYAEVVKAAGGVRTAVETKSTAIIATAQAEKAAAEKMQAKLADIL